MTLAAFNSNYKYMRDYRKGKKTEAWTVMKPNVDGTFIGDCEDYCLTLRDKVDNFDVLTMYFCRIKTEGHLVGRVGGLYIDCNTQRLVDKKVLTKAGYNSFRRVSEFEIWIKMLSTKLFGRVLWV